jgi:hypothetical protein
MRRFAISVIACALLGAWSAAPAGAHTGQDDGMSCAGITLELADFPAGENTVTTTITIDGVPIDPVVSTFQGPAATLLVPLPPFTGTHQVMYQTSWTVDGGGQTDVAVTTITCGASSGPTGPAADPCHRHRHLRWPQWWSRVQGRAHRS